MERAGETVESITSGQFDLRQEQKLPEEKNASREKLKNVSSARQQTERQKHTFQKVPQGCKHPEDSDSYGSNPYVALVDRLRATWLTEKTRPMEYRRAQLEALGRFLDENKCEILQALKLDMHTPAFEGEIADVSLVRGEVNNALNNLCYWMTDEYVSKNPATSVACAFIRKDPYGVMLIVSPYSNPFHHTLLPVVGAIAAGNCVIVKPSELSRCSEKVLAEVLPTYLDPDTFAVVTGGPEEAAKLLENKFDYIFFTGSSNTGKIVMNAAARHLTPLTLELSGQNPCYVDSCCDFQNAARRIVWTKFFGTGQICPAPNYVICTAETQDRLIPCLRQAIQCFYGSNPQESPDFGRMINDEHFQHVRAFLKCGRVVIGGETDECDHYIAPTVLADVKEWEPVMQEEIFGPVLPIFTVASLDEAIQYINSKDRPLIVYAFSSNHQTVDRVLACTSSGNFSGNDGVMGVTLVSLPYGGVGCSGFGKYRGKFSFDTFSNQRACLIRGMGFEALSYMRYPPYTECKLRALMCTTEVRRRNFCPVM